MGNLIGIRHEDKYDCERRAPLTPYHVKKLTDKYGLKIAVQRSERRIFDDEEYTAAGAKLADNLSDCNVIFGVKEMPVSFFEPNKTYIFFSHIIKGQKYNMPMLARMMELKCNLIDYEKISDERNQRLIFFGRYAGLAGMINTLWATGKRLEKEYGLITPLINLKQAHKYPSLLEAEKEISSVGQQIIEKGFPKNILPLTIAFTGSGNVSKGAQEILSLLPVKEIFPEELLHLKDKKHIPDNIIYKVVFNEEDMFAPIDPSKRFDLEEYYNLPNKYYSIFEKYLPDLTVLMNCMYWDEKYPKILTKKFLHKEANKGNMKLKVVGDITCDINGSVEITVKSSTIENPVFIYNPDNGNTIDGFKGSGVLNMAVDILPSELPYDASMEFGNLLMDFVKPLAMADYDLPFVEIDLPLALKKALILHKGELTPDYTYIADYL